MKAISLLLSLLFCINISFGQKKQTETLKQGRIEKVINSQWTFNYFPSEAADKGYESPGFNDSRWPAISLPHTWNSYETTGELRPFTRSPGETGDTYWWSGWGWYRKHFSLNSGFSDHKVFIEFDGVQKYCKVWVNGKYAGDHKGGYGSFDFDITGLLIPNGDNLIAVAVSYLQKDEFRIHPLSEGDFNVSCGIYRDVRLVLKNKLFIPMQGSATHEGGTLITTPGVSEKEGVVKIRTWVKNDYPQSRTCLLQTSISDMSGQVIQIIKTEMSIDAGQLYMFGQTSKPVKNPQLWSVEDPYLYTINSEVIDKKDVVDACTSSFGFRWFKIDEKNNTFYLNDKKIELKGVIRHQEYPWLGDAVPGWMTERDYSEISGKKGKSFVRTIIYPGDGTSYKQADEHGIITEAGFSAVTCHNFSAEEQKQQVREMIRKGRNHPAIISWNIGDEEGSQANKIFAATEDSTRSFKNIMAKIDTSRLFFVRNNINDSSDIHSGVTGEPSKIIVSSSHKKIAADKGSVVIITAEIADPEGNFISGARNTLRWSVSGPASLSGPAYYVSYSDSSRTPAEGWYMEMPSTNIIRSDGKPGKIKVSVFSAGVASGSCEIEAEEIMADNSSILEPVLADGGRKAVVSNTLVTERLEDATEEISMVSGDFNLNQMGKNEYFLNMRDYIKKNNPLADTTSIEFKTLTNLLAKQLFNNKGNLPAADYNFNAEHFNNSRIISGYIAKTKLPPLFKESLRSYYSKIIIARGIEKNAGDEMNWLNWIPSGGIIVIVPDKTTNTSQKGIIFTKQTELPDIIKVVYPQFTRFSDDARERALIFISKMNPDVRVFRASGENPGANGIGSGKISYIAEKGVPILIPEYKFISE